MTLPRNIKRSLGNKEFGIQPYRTAKNYAGMMRKPTEASVGFVTIREEKGRPTELWRPYVGDQGYQLQRYEVTPPPGEPASEAMLDVGYDLEAYEAGEGFAEYWVPGEPPTEIFKPGALFSAYAGRTTDVVSVITTMRYKANPFFKPDGYELYCGDNVNQTVAQYTLSTAWDLSTASYTDDIDVSSEINYDNLDSLSFSDDGTKMYIGHSPDWTIYQYTLTTAWDITTASYASKSFDYSAQGLMDNIGHFIGNSGTKLYIIGYIPSGGYSRARQFTLSTPWDIATASYDSGKYMVPLNRPNDIFFNSAGSKMYITRHTTQDLREYTLGTNWDISTETLNDTYDFSGEVSNSSGMFYKPDGSKIYMLDWNLIKLFQYSSNVAWDIDLTYDSVEKSLVPPGVPTTPSGVFFNFREPVLPEPRNQFRAFITDPINNTIICHEEDGFDLRTNYINEDDISGQEPNVRGLFFHPEGLKAYLVGLTNTNIYQYVLTTKFDLDTMSYDSKFFDVSAYDINPMELFFRPDGAQVFMVGFDTAAIYRFELSTPWDISTASFSDNYLSVAAEETEPTGMWISPDGQELYVSGTSSDLIHKYILDVPGDLTMARYTKNYYDTTELIASPRGIFFDDEDMGMMYVVDWDTSKIYQYHV